MVRAWSVLKRTAATAAVASLAIWEPFATSLAQTGGSPRGPDPMVWMEEKVRGLFPGVSHIGPAQLVRLMGHRADALLLVDVRAPVEFEVSRIEGAQLLDDSLDARRAAATLGDVSGRTVVLYCAIGLRSSRLAMGIERDLRARGAAAVHNLSGGLFRWHNERRPLVDAKGPTELIHPYRRFWRRYLDRPSLASEEPAPDR